MIMQADFMSSLKGEPIRISFTQGYFVSNLRKLSLMFYISVFGIKRSFSSSVSNFKPTSLKQNICPACGSFFSVNNRILSKGIIANLCLNLTYQMKTFHLIFEKLEYIDQD